nr:MAG: polyprotein [Picornavirales sp.]
MVYKHRKNRRNFGNSSATVTRVAPKPLGKVPSGNGDSYGRRQFSYAEHQARRDLLPIDELDDKIWQEDQITNEDGDLKTRLVLVSKKLHEDLVKLAGLLRKAGRKITRKRDKHGFIHEIREYRRTKQMSFLKRCIVRHCNKMGIYPRPVHKNEDFIKYIITLFPELYMLENSIFKINYINSFNFNINKVAIYREQQVGHQKERDEFWFPNKYYHNDKINYFKNLIMNKFNNNNNKFRHPAKTSGKVVVGITHKKKKADTFKGQISNLKDFPNLQGDDAFKKTKAKMAKIYAVIPKITITAPPEEIAARQEARRAKRAAKAGPTEEQLLADRTPHINGWTYSEDPSYRRIAYVLRRTAFIGKCSRCNILEFKGRLPLTEVKNALSYYTKCKCIVAEQQSDEEQARGYLSSLKEGLSDFAAPFKQAAALKECLDHPLIGILSDKDKTNDLIANLRGQLKSEELKGVKDTVDSLTTELGRVLDNLDSIKALVDKGKSIADDIKSMKSAFKMDSWNKKLAHTFSILVGLMASIPLYMKMSWSDRMILLSSQVCILGLPVWAGEKIRQIYVSAMTPKAEEAEILQQSDTEDYSRLVAPMVKILSIGMASVVSNNEGEVAKNIIKSGNIARSFTSIKNFSDLVYTSVDETRKCLYTLATGLPAEAGDLTGVIEGLGAWMEAIATTIENPEWMATYMQDTRNLKALNTLIETGDMLQIKVFKLSTGEALRFGTYMTKTLSMLRKLATALKAARTGTKDRVLPVSILFNGPPGMGKTHTINQLVVDLFDKQEQEYKSQYSSMEEIKFTKAPTSDYYDGYLNHFAYVQDEIFQSTDKQKNVADCDQLMGLIQESSAPLDMARLEGKGSVYFMSKYVLFTTNKTDIMSGLPMVEPGAIRRRLHNTVAMQVNRRFLHPTTRRLDVNRWERYCHEHSLRPEQPNYARFLLRTVGEADRIVTYDELVNILHDQQVRHQTRFEATQASQKQAFAGEAELDGAPNLIWDDVLPAMPYGVHDAEAQGAEEDDFYCCAMANDRKIKKDHTSDDCSEYWAIEKRVRNLTAKMENLNLEVPTIYYSCFCEVDLDCPHGDASSCLRKTYTKMCKIYAASRKEVGSQVEESDLKSVVEGKLATLHDSLTSVNKDFVRASIETQPTKQAVDQLEKWLKKTGCRDEQELIVFNWINMTIPAEKRLTMIGKTRHSTCSTTRDKLKAAFPMSGVHNKAYLTTEEYAQLQDDLDTKVVSTFRMRLRWYWHKIKSNPLISVVGFLTSMGALVLGGFLVYQHYKKPSAKESTESEASAYDGKDKGSLRRTYACRQSEDQIVKINGIEVHSHAMERNEELADAEEQAAADLNWESQLMKVMGNLMHVTHCDDLGFSDNIIRTRGIAVLNDYALMVKHAIKDNKGHLKITRGGLTLVVAVKDLKIVSIGERWSYDDVILVKFPTNKLGGIKPIISLFCPTKDLKTFSDGWGELMVVDREKKMVVRHASPIETNFSEPVRVKVDDSGSSKVLATGFTYYAPTQKGDCGSPLIRWDANRASKILGLHVAGRADGKATAYACCVDREWIEENIRILGPPVTIEQGDETPLYGGSNDLVDAMDIVGHTSPRTRLPDGQSVFIPSPFAQYKFKPFSTAPAIRTIQGPDSALTRVLGKYRKEAPYVDLQLVKRITVVLSQQFTPQASRKIFSYEESLNVLDTVRSVDLSTSMGYPWNLKQKKKSDFVRYNEDTMKFEFIDDSILERCRENEQKIAAHCGRDFIFVACLKDERLPLEAVERLKVRLFLICPFDLTLLVRRYFGSFIEEIHRLKFELGVCVGIDPHSEDWGQLARCLLKHNTEMFEIDYSNWDRSIPMEFLSVFFDLADRFYQDEHANVRRYVRAAILNPTYQMKYFRYRILAGNPSGCPVTTELNSIANLALTLYVICQFGHSPGEAYEHSFIATYGDDSVISTSLFLDEEGLKGKIAQLGLIATGAKKDQPVKRKPLRDIQFLKRNFIFYNGQYYAPLLMDSIMESMMWVRRGQNQAYNFTQTINNALVELQQYPPEEVTERYLRIFEFARRCNFRVGLSEHAIISLNSQADREGEASLLDAFCCGILAHTLTEIALYLYRKWKLPKDPIKWNDPIFSKTSFDVQYCIVDLERRGLKHLALDTYYHVGFRCDEWEKELTFTDKGPAWIPKAYCPHQTFAVTITRDAIREGLKTGPYHLVRNNCMSWCEEVLERSGVLQEHWPRLYAKFAQISQEQLFGKWANEQSDDITDGVMATQRITFLESQQVTSGQEIRSISEMLGSDTLLKSVKWGINNAYDSVIHKVDLPNNLAVVKQFECKLKFTALLRTDIRIRVEVSALKMYSGTLVIYWVPCSSEGLPKGMTITAKQATGMEHVLLQLPEMNSVEMVIPFTHFKNFVSQTDFEDNEIGTLYIKVLNKLQPPKDGGTEVLLKVLANYVNAQAIVTTPLSKQSKWEGGDDIYPKFAKKQSDEADEKSAQGIISGPTTTLANLADLIGGIPIFSGVASTVSVMARTAASIAEYMGLSKPRNLQTTRPTTSRVFSSVSYADAQDNSTVLGLNPKNSVVIQPSLFGTLTDQMSINYLVRQESVVLIKGWSVSDELGKTMFRIPVHPFIGSKHKESGKYNPIQMSYMGYVASCFRYWRGTIRMRVQVVATDLHAGSLIIGFIPRGTVDGDSEFQYETTLKTILDLSTTRDQTIDVPFISTNMLNVLGCPFDSIELDGDSATGTLVLKVEKPLMTSGIASDTIEINIWISAGEDFELHYPSLDCINSFSYTGVENIEESFGLRPTVGKRTDLVVGEEILSIRQLLKVGTMKFGGMQLFSPGVSEIYFPAHTFTGEDSNVEAYDTYYSHLMRLYRFSRGSIRHKVMFPSYDVKASAIASLGFRSEYVWEHHRTLEGAPWTTTHGKVNPTLEYEIPFYNIHKMEVHGKNSSFRGAIVQFEKLNTETERGKVLLYESIGDDFSCGYMMGPPVLYQKRDFIYKFLYAVKNASKARPLVDGYYNYEKWSEKETGVKIIQDSQVTTLQMLHQKFYYMSSMPKYLLLVADLDFVSSTLVDLITPTSNRGFVVNKAVCFIRKDGVSYDQGSYSYDHTTTPLNGAWFGVHSSTEGLRLYAAKANGLPKNVKSAILKDDVLCDLLCSQKNLAGRSQVIY